MQDMRLMRNMQQCLNARTKMQLLARRKVPNDWIVRCTRNREQVLKSVTITYFNRSYVPWATTIHYAALLWPLVGLPWCEI